MKGFNVLEPYWQKSAALSLRLLSNVAGTHNVLLMPQTSAVSPLFHVGLSKIRGTFKGVMGHTYIYIYIYICMWGAVI